MLKKLLILTLFALTACNEPAKEKEVITDKVSASQSQTEQNNNLTHFNGCYTVDKTVPAQIKISELDGKFVMQMKEPKGAKSLWDTPEPLAEMSVEQVWGFFGVNALSLDKSDVESVLARPDEMMILAKVKSASQNINPLLDSPYVVYIFKGANTIYQVPCDEMPIDIIKDGQQAVKKAYQ